jgi:flagella basal body P-ring formation protein FlgA
MASVATPLEAQRVAAVGAHDFADVLAELVAPGLGVSPERVRVDWAGDPPVADFVRVDGAGSGRWVATLWSAGVVTRRYVRVGLERQVPVAARQLDRGEEIAHEDVRLESRVLWGAAAGDAVDLDAVGMVASRVVAEGEILAAPAVRPPLLVRGGEEVEAVLEQSGVLLRARAEALGSARRGESVYVRLTSGKRMAARAVGLGVVRLQP